MCRYFLNNLIGVRTGSLRNHTVGTGMPVHFTDVRIRAPDGKNGTDGKNGLDGKDGTDGKNGLDGKNGTDGKNGLCLLYTSRCV